jgi:hypothetical protein
MSASSSRKKSPRPLGRPPKVTTVRINNIAVLYEALRESDRGVPLVTVIGSLSKANPEEAHLKLKRGWRTILPKWRELGWREKELLRQLALDRAGDASTFNLNLGTALLASHTYGDRESRNSLRDRVAKALRREFERDVPFTMTLEVDPGGRLHVHGSAAIGHLDRERLESCLKRAGGEWGHKSGEAFQAKADRLSWPQGWAEYITKLLTPRNPVQAKAVIAKSHSMDSLANSLYTDIVRFLRDHSESVETLRVGYTTEAGDESTEILRSLLSKAIGR